MSAGLTTKQAAFLAYLKRCGDHTPSMAQMAAHLGYRSVSGVHRMVEALEHRGFIERAYGAHRAGARAIRVLDAPAAFNLLLSDIPTRSLVAALKSRGFTFHGKAVTT